VHHECLHQGQYMNLSTKWTIMQCLWDAVCHKWSSDTWLLHHDSVTCHTAINVREFLAKHSIPVVPHLPYSPDLAPMTSSSSPGW
jgi:hypothetical protein